MRFATVRPPTDPHWMEYSPTFHGTNPGKRSVDHRLLERPRARPRAAARRTGRRRRRELHAAGDAQRRSRRTTTSCAPSPTSCCCACPRSALDGPWRDHTGFAQTTEQVSGIAWLTGEAGGRAARALDHRPDRRDPRRVRGARGVGAPRRHRRGAADRDADGRGRAERRRRADRHLVGLRHAARREGNRGPNGAPQGVYACAATSSGSHCRSSMTSSGRHSCAVLGDPAWARDADARDRRGAARAP